MMLKSLRIGKVDSMLLVGVFCNIREVKSEGFAQTTELDFPLVLQAELEGLLGDLLQKTKIRFHFGRTRE